MDRIRYNWRDFSLCYRFSMDMRRLVIGSAFVLWTLLMLWGVDIFTHWNFLPDVVVPVSRTLEGWAEPAFLTGMTFAWWWVAARFIVALMRGAALELCADKRADFSTMLGYAGGYGKRHARAPLAVVLYAAPLWVGVLLWALLSMIPVAGTWIAILSSPIAFIASALAAGVIVTGILALPLQAASVATHGGDTYEALSRACMYTTMAPQRYAMWFVVKVVMLAVAAALAALVFLLGVALLCCVYGLVAGWNCALDLVHVMTWVYPAEQARHIDPTLAQGVSIGVWICGLMVPGYVLSFGTASDVLLFLLLRHWCDGTPANEYFEPTEAWSNKVTRMEQEQALAARTAASQNKPLKTGQEQPQENGEAAVTKP